MKKSKSVTYNHAGDGVAAPHNIPYEDDDFMDKVDLMQNAFIGNQSVVRFFSEYDKKLYKDVQLAFTIVADPNIPDKRNMSAIMNFLKCTNHRALRLIKIVEALVTRPKDVNKDFKRRVVASKIYKMALDAEEVGDMEVALEFYKEYNKLEGLYDHTDKKVDPTTLILPIPVYSTNPKVLEEAEIIEDAAE